MHHSRSGLPRRQTAGVKQGLVFQCRLSGRRGTHRLGLVSSWSASWITHELGPSAAGLCTLLIWSSSFTPSSWMGYSTSTSSQICCGRCAAHHEASLKPELHGALEEDLWMLLYSLLPLSSSCSWWYHCHHQTSLLGCSWLGRVPTLSPHFRVFCFSWGQKVFTCFLANSLCVFYWGLTSVWPLDHRDLIGGLLPPPVDWVLVPSLTEDKLAQCLGPCFQITYNDS